MIIHGDALQVLTEMRARWHSSTAAAAWASS